MDTSYDRGQVLSIWFLLIPQKEKLQYYTSMWKPPSESFPFSLKLDTNCIKSRKQLRFKFYSDKTCFFKKNTSSLQKTYENVAVQVQSLLTQLRKKFWISGWFLHDELVILNSWVAPPATESKEHPRLRPSSRPHLLVTAFKSASS